MKEAVHGSPIEDHRVRTFVLKLHLEDGTIEVTELTCPNSGMRHGPFLKRHQILNPDTGTALTFKDIKCGTNLDLYSRVLRIVSMDIFTRRFYESQEVDPGIEERIPEDSFTVNSKMEAENQNRPLPLDVIREKALVNVLCGGTELNRKVKQYIFNSGKILRFYATWDDESEDGYIHMFDIHYFLSDHTVEIVETRDGERMLFFKRSVISKHGIGAAISDKYDERNQDILTARDFWVGAIINLGGRKFILKDCDAFTRQYYQTELGIILTDPLISNRDNVGKVQCQRAIPPYNGFGSEEDSLASCDPKSLVPKLRVKIYQGNEDLVLRFKAIIESANKNDMMRRFVVCFFPCDESLSVFEETVRNSGMLGGKFAERARRKNEAGVYYSAKDMHVGAIIKVSGVNLHLTACDTFTETYLNSK